MRLEKIDWLTSIFRPTIKNHIEWIKKNVEIVMCEALFRIESFDCDPVEKVLQYHSLQGRCNRSLSLCPLNVKIRGERWLIKMFLTLTPKNFKPLGLMVKVSFFWPMVPGSKPWRHEQLFFPFQKMSHLVSTLWVYLSRGHCRKENLSEAHPIRR